VLVRKFGDAATIDVHRLRSHILMDAGELGSRNMSVTWIEVPSGVDQELHSHEEAEQVYVITSGRGSMTVAGDTQEVSRGDLVMVPPATDHSIANPGASELCCVSVQSPPVTVAEIFARTVAAGATDYDDEDF